MNDESNVVHKRFRDFLTGGSGSSGFAEVDRLRKLILTSGEGSLLVTINTGKGDGWRNDVPLRMGESKGSYSKDIASSIVFGGDDSSRGGTAAAASFRNTTFPVCGSRVKMPSTGSNGLTSKDTTSPSRSTCMPLPRLGTESLLTYNGFTDQLKRQKEPSMLWSVYGDRTTEVEDTESRFADRADFLAAFFFSRGCC